MSAAAPDRPVTRLRAPQGEFELERYPVRPREPLRAWDGADEHLLAHLAGHDPAGGGEAPAPVDLSGTVVIVNDAWGALSTALAGAAPILVTDSALAEQAARRNVARHAGAAAGTGLDVRGPLDDLPERIDVLLVRVPRTLALLEFQLARLAPALRPGAVVIGAGLTKDVHTSTLQAFERFVGPTRTSRAARKARLVHAVVDPDRDPGPLDWPRRYEVAGAGGGFTAVNHAGVFSAHHLDVGAGLLLATIPGRLGPPGARVLDLGCGNGVLGTAAALADPSAEVVFVDESRLALASAQATLAAAAPGRTADFRLGGTLADAEVPAASVDVVLNNPPFHSHQAISDATAWRMFVDARRALRPGGELRVVGNRHLGYHVKLARLFGNCAPIASNAKFVVLRSIR